MISAAPTVLTVQADSAWLIILAVSVVTLPLVMMLRKLIARPGGIASGLLLLLPLALPVVAALLYERGAGVSLLEPAVPALLDGSPENVRLLPLTDRSGMVMLYRLSGLGGWLLLLGGTITAVMLIRRVVGHIALRGLLRRCRRPGSDESMLDLAVSRLADRSGLKRCPELLILPEERCAVAFTTGNRIVVSSGLVGALDPAELEAVMAHEVAHARAGDVPLLLIAGVLRDLAVWNPLAHLALRRLTNDREYEADRRAAALVGDPLVVASGLVKMCELLMRGGRLRSRAVPAFARRGRGIKRRVAHLLALAEGPTVHDRSHWAPYLAAAALVVLFGLRAGASLAEERGAALVVRWGSTVTGDVWVPPAGDWDAKRGRVEQKKGRANERQAREQARRLARLRSRYMREFASGPVFVRPKHLPAYMDALAAVTQRYGSERSFDVRLEDQTTTVLSGDGAVGIYRLRRV